jgi:hypothetical protein
LLDRYDQNCGFLMTLFFFFPYFTVGDANFFGDEIIFTYYFGGFGAMILADLPRFFTFFFFFLPVEVYGDIS